MPWARPPDRPGPWHVTRLCGRRPGKTPRPGPDGSRRSHAAGSSRGSRSWPRWCRAGSPATHVDGLPPRRTPATGSPYPAPVPVGRLGHRAQRRDVRSRGRSYGDHGPSLGRRLISYRRSLRWLPPSPVPGRPGLSTRRRGGERPRTWPGGVPGAGGPRLRGRGPAGRARRCRAGRCGSRLPASRRGPGPGCSGGATAGLRGGRAGRPGGGRAARSGSGPGPEAGRDPPPAPRTSRRRGVRSGSNPSSSANPPCRPRVA